ncbi:MAG TPA: transposase [Planctomycetaceae bacterium]|nr:transposase [Planctomycetaceae bacterium]
MGAPYSQDLRDRVLRAYDRGMKTKQIAEVFAVSKAWARRVKQRYREHGETRPRKMGGPGVIKVDRVRLAELVAEHPDATASELRELLGVECSESTIYMALKALKLTYKKRRSMRPSRIALMSPRSDKIGKHARNSSRRAD